MEDSFIFLIGSTQMISHVLAVKSICVATLKEKPDAPPKFKLGIECAEQMLNHQVVNREQFLAFLDVIGGFYSAAKTFYEKYSDKGPKARKDLDEAEDLLRFAIAPEAGAPKEWGLGK